MEGIDATKHNSHASTVNEITKIIRKKRQLIMDEAWKLTPSYEEQLKIFIKSCDGITFSSRGEVIHTLVNKVDSHLVEENYKLLIRELETNINACKDVFVEFNIPF